VIADACLLTQTKLSIETGLTLQASVPPADLQMCDENQDSPYDKWATEEGQTGKEIARAKREVEKFT